MLYVLIFCVGIIIGMIVITLINLNSKRKEEKQIFQEYKTLINECFQDDNTDKNGKKKESK